MEKVIITRRMIQDHLGRKEGYRVKIKRNSLVYRQRAKGEIWEYMGKSSRIAYDYAKQHGIKDWEMEGMLSFDSRMHMMDSLREHGLIRTDDCMNFMRLILNHPFNDIYREGLPFIIGNRPKEPEDAIYFDCEHQDRFVMALNI